MSRKTNKTKSGDGSFVEKASSEEQFEEVIGCSSTESVSTSTATSLRSYFSSTQWIVWGVIILVGIALRWLNLADRPLHHDESLHAMWGKYYFDHPGLRFYKYDPMMHGPFLYNLLVAVYHVVGDSVWAARAPMAFLGSFSLFLPIIFRRFFSAQAALILTGVLALSPTLVYYSRFCRHDFIALLGIFLTVYGVLQAKPKNKALFFFVGIAIQIAAKENSFVHLAIFLGYLIFEALFELVINNRYESILLSAFRYLWSYWAQVLLGFLLGALVYTALFSAGFNYPEGILDGLFRKSIMYWWNQSSIERIKGPFMFHIYVMAFYELPLLLLIVFQVAHFYWRASFPVRIGGIATVVIALGFWGGLWYYLPEGKGQEQYVRESFSLWEFLKLKGCFDVFGSILFPVHAFLITVEHLRRNEKWLAITGYFFGATLFSYSYLGEKVPWLTLYPLISGIIYLVLYFDRVFQERPVKSYRVYPVSEILFGLGVGLIVLAVIFTVQAKAIEGNWWFFGIGGILIVFYLIDWSLGKLLVVKAFSHGSMLPQANLLVVGSVVFALFSFRATSLTNFVFGGNEREFMSQVHTVSEAIDVADMIVNEVVSQRRGYQPHIFVEGEATWPLTWYFRKLPTYDYINKDKRSGYLFRIEDWKEGVPPPSGFKARRINLRGWWVPDYQQINLKRVIRYYLSHETWNPPGFSYVNLYTRLAEEGYPVPAKEG